MTPPGTASMARRSAEGVAVVALYTGLALGLLHSLFAHPASTVVDPIAEGARGWLLAPDVNLVMWILSWDYHALTTSPMNLFNANIFHPAPDALASSEHLLGHLPLFAPVYGLTGNPVLANQVNILLAIALCGASMYALLRHWNCSRPAAFFGGFIYAFAPIRVYTVASAHLIAGQYLPLALLYLDRTLDDGRLRSAMGCAFFLLLQALCSYYLAYMTATAVAGYLVGVLCARRGHLQWRGVAAAGVAGAVAGTVFILVSLPYLRLRNVGVLPDYSQALNLRLPSSTGWWNYLHRPATFHISLSLYVGLLPTICCGVALLPRRRSTAMARRGAVAAAIGVMVAGFLMALGPRLSLGDHVISLPYGWAMHVVPGFSSMRVPARFALVVILGVAALAGLGLGRLLQFAEGSWWRHVLALGVASVFTATTAYDYGLFSYRYPMRSVAMGAALPGVYQALAAAPPGPILELPAGRSDVTMLVRESAYMFHSTFHWRPLLNGYSGYYPPSYDPVIALADALPDAHALEILVRATGLRYVIVHLADLDFVQRRAWADPLGFKRLGQFGDDLLLTVQQPRAADLESQLIDFQPQARTLLGTPLLTVPKDERQAALAFATPPDRVVVAGLPAAFEVLVTNHSDVTWPTLATVGEHRVTLGYRWENDRGGLEAENLAAVRLPYDLTPGASVRTPLQVRPPLTPGQYRLVVGLVQDGEWFADKLGPTSISVAPVEALRRMAEQRGFPPPGPAGHN
jgi:hypothetical protein